MDAGLDHRMERGRRRMVQSRGEDISGVRHSIRTTALRQTAALQVMTAAQLNITTPPVRHGFREPTDIPGATGNDPLLLELIDTPAFQRLKEIRFLGAIDYCRIPRPNGRPGATRYSRYEHSLGVMQLARLYCIRREMPRSECRLACAAALLHDIGHPPLSHSVESVFKEEFGIDHHVATEDIICGRVPLGRSVFSTLCRHRINVEELVAAVSGEIHRFDGFFRGPINFDTIEGILRSYRYTGRTSSISNPEIVTEAAIRRINEKDRDVVDGFWKCKDWVYNHIINSREGVLSDFVCKLLLRRNLARVDRNSFFGTEERLFQKLPDLRKLLTSRTFKEQAMRMVSGHVRYVGRSYYIDQDGDFFSRQDDIRYRHRRRQHDLSFEVQTDSVTAESATEQQGVLFDDHTV